MTVRPMIVVGVDGSEGATQALRFAIAEARRRGASVKVVTAYDLPTYWALPSKMPTLITDQEIGDAVLGNTQALVDQLVTSEPAAPKTEVRAVAGSPAQVLVDEAKGAELLVVGHRGRGGVGSMLLGSVGLQCVLHAPCTVTVVRDDK